MSSPHKQQVKPNLHPRNKNREPYDLGALVKVLPELKNHIKPNKFGNDSVDFSNPSAVRLLNKALLNHYYGIKNWEFPNENLCPPIPGRADYLHYIADLLAKNNSNQIPTGNTITGLDIGTGATCIYPIIGTVTYGWNFKGSDIDTKSIENAKSIVGQNDSIRDKIEFDLQPNSNNIFEGIVSPNDRFDFTMCNPPFHASLKDAEQGTRRKVQNLSGKRGKTPILNFAGNANELVCEGGEYAFIVNMIKESKQFAKSCYYFTTLVAKQAHLKGLYKCLENVGAKEVQTIPMGTGNKITRVLVWTFLNKDEQKRWMKDR